MPRNLFYGVTAATLLASIAMPAIAAAQFHGERFGYAGLFMTVAVLIALFTWPLVRSGISRWGGIRQRAIAGAVAVGLMILLIVPAFAASPTVTLSLPSSMAFAQVIGRSGTIYTPNAQGQVTATNGDAIGFIQAGAIVVPAGSSAGRLALLNGHNGNGSVLVASSAASGNFLISLTPGTSEALTGESAQGNTKTDAAVFELVLPPTYVAGLPLTATVYASYSGTGTVGATATVAVAAYLAADAGTEGSNLVTASAQAITTSGATYSFAIPGATLAPGMRVLLKVTTALQETGGSAALIASVGSVAVQ